MPRSHLFADFDRSAAPVAAHSGTPASTSECSKILSNSRTVSNLGGRSGKTWLRVINMEFAQTPQHLQYWFQTQRRAPTEANVVVIETNANATAGDLFISKIISKARGWLGVRPDAPAVAVADAPAVAVAVADASPSSSAKRRSVHGSESPWQRVSRKMGPTAPPANAQLFVTTAVACRNPDVVAGIMDPNYASPETMKGDKESHQVDLWAVAVLMFELVTNRFPFGDPFKETVEQIGTRIVTPNLPAPLVNESSNKSAKAVSDGYQQLVARALDKDPQKRFGSVEEMIQQLEVVQHDLEIEESNRRHQLRQHRQMELEKQKELAQELDKRKSENQEKQAQEKQKQEKFQQELDRQREQQFHQEQERRRQELEQKQQKKKEALQQQLQQLEPQHHLPQQQQKEEQAEQTIMPVPQERAVGRFVDIDIDFDDNDA
jgi:hypothetical protein